MQLEVDRALEDGATAAKEAAARLAAADAEIASLREEVSSHQAEMTSIRAALSSLQEERAKEALPVATVPSANTSPRTSGGGWSPRAAGRLATPGRKSIQDLEVVLGSATHMLEFREYARRQGAEGYLMFWQDVQDYTELTATLGDDAVSLAQAASMIYDKYLAPRAQKKVRVVLSAEGSEIVRRSTSTLSEHPENADSVFDEAVREVFAFLKNKLYPKFQKSIGKTKNVQAWLSN